MSKFAYCQMRNTGPGKQQYPPKMIKHPHSIQSFLKIKPACLIMTVVWQDTSWFICLHWVLFTDSASKACQL